MRILIFTPYIGSNYGGLSKAVKDIAEALAHLEVKVDLITTDANNCEKIPVHLNEWIDENNYRIKYFPCWQQRDFVISLSLIKWLIQHIGDYDIIHTNTVFAPIVSFVHWLCQWRKNSLHYDAPRNA